MPTPTQEMAEEAQRGLDWREEYGRGGTEVGVARARDISNRRNLSMDTVGRMVSYFARHEVDKEAEGFRPGEEGYPSAGRIAWALWGGDPGQAWANRVLEQEEERMKAEPGELSVGDFVRWNSSGGIARGRIDRIETDGQIDVPDSDFTITGSEEDPAALITIYRPDGDGWEETDTQVGHRFSTLTLIDPLPAPTEERQGGSMERKAFTFKMDDLDEEGFFTGYASTFDEDSMGDTILPGAFKRTLNSWRMKNRPIPVLYQHKADEPIGATIEAMEDERGLRVKGRLLMGIAKAREAYEAAKAGVLGGLSIGFSIPRDGATRNQDGTREIKELKLYEYSFVTFPANESAVLTGVKNDQPELREMVTLLHDIKRELRAASVATVKPVDETAPASELSTLLAEVRQYRETLNSNKGDK